VSRADLCRPHHALRQTHELLSGSAARRCLTSSAAAGNFTVSKDKLGDPDAGPLAALYYDTIVQGTAFAAFSSPTSSAPSAS